MMPVFCYSREGAVRERFVQCGKTPPRFIRVDGVRFDRDFRAERVSPPPPGNYPMVCEFAGVHPEQVPQFERMSREAGCPTHYNPEGDPIITSRTHYNKLLRSRGMVNRAGGLTDFTGS